MFSGFLGSDIGRPTIGAKTSVLALVLILMWTIPCESQPEPIISGHVRFLDGSGIPGVTVSADSGGGSATTDASGYYSLTVPYGWSGTVRPSKTGHTFSPSSKGYGGIASNVSDQDYTGTLIRHISGYIDISVGPETSGFTVSADNGGGSATTSASGYYSLTVPDGWSGAITPSKADYAFDPPSRSYSDVSSDQSNQNYTATPVPRTISGDIRFSGGLGARGVTVSADNGGGSATTNSSGHYSLTVPYGWSGSVNPSKLGYTFSPTWRPYNNVICNWNSEHYTVTAYAETVYVDDDARGRNDGTSWADAYNYLQDGLAAAKRHVGGEVHVAQGVYRPDEGAGVTRGDREATFELVEGVTIRGGYAGCGVPNPHARNVRSYETTLSGDLDGNDRAVEDPCSLLGLSSDPTWHENSHNVIVSRNMDKTAILDGFTIAGGTGTAQSPGGGMYSEQGNATVKNCLFRLNCGGGAVYNREGSPTFIDCTFEWNVGERGGAMYNVESEAPTFINCRFIGNVAASLGGGMYSEYFHTEGGPLLLNCIFSGNWADQRGGGMGNYGTGCLATLINCTFSGNPSPEGGGIANYDCSPQLVNCILWGNRDAGTASQRTQLVGGSPLLDFCCVEGWTGTLGGEGNTGSDPMFIDPDGADDIVGTQDDDPRLRSFSDCIDTGDTGVLPDDMWDLDEDGDLEELVPFDVGRRKRVVGHVIDIGAYEWQGTQPQVAYPSASGITWNNGRSYTIRWDGFDCGSVKIELYHASVLHKTLVNATPNDESYTWTVPSD